MMIIHFASFVKQQYDGRRFVAAVCDFFRSSQPLNLTVPLSKKCINIKSVYGKEKKKVQVAKKEKTKVAKKVIVKKMGLGDALEQVQVEQLLEITANILTNA